MKTNKISTTNLDVHHKSTSWLHTQLFQANFGSICTAIE